MLFESTSLASTVMVVLEAMDKRYGIDARPILESHGIDLGKIHVPGARFSSDAMKAAIDELIEVTGDPCLGLAIGEHVRPSAIHGLGFSWLASDTLKDAFERLARFDQTVSTSDHIRLRRDGERYSLMVGSRMPGYLRPPVAIDAYFVAIMRLCHAAKDRNFRPLEVRLLHGDFGRPGDYVDAFRAPVIFEADADELVFDRESVEAPLPGANKELAAVNERVIEAYIESLDLDLLSSRVRSLLIESLASGDATQEQIAAKLARSTSTLQRQLRAEGTSFAKLRDDTRRDIAMRCLSNGDTSINEVAFLVGFTDPSNFSRAFRRWTGLSPREWKSSRCTIGRA